jgi:hypothetical protein
VYSQEFADYITGSTQPNARLGLVTWLSWRYATYMSTILDLLSFQGTLLHSIRVVISGEGEPTKV